MAPHNPPDRDHSPLSQRICTHITPIPLPADDCDRVHSTHAALSSLDAAATSFDAAMDSLSATTARHRLRVRDLERRMARFRGCLRRLDDLASSRANEGPDLDDAVVAIYCPGSYESALRGMESELAAAKEGLESGPRPAPPSGDSAARSAADAAVQRALLRDVSTDDGRAVPSDAWLDHATAGLGVERALEATDEQRCVPPLLREDVAEGEAEYGRVLDTLDASANRDAGFDRLDSLEESVGGGGGGRGDDESVYSTTSQMSSISMASSTRMTAGQRRRWHKQQQLQSARSGRASKSRSMTTPLSPHPEAPSSSTSSRTTSAAAAGRQQSLAGSHPYLCEVFHDSYGIGPAPPRGLVDCAGFSSRRTREGGTGFYPPASNVTELLVFNTARSSYGATGGARAANVPTSTSGTASSRAAKERGAERGGASPNPSVPAARKSQSSGAGKPSLANLVFKADATESKAAGPALDLPDSLPPAIKLP